MRISDLRGTMQLAFHAATGVTRIVEGVHQSVWDRLGFPGRDNSGRNTPGKTRGITGSVFRMIEGVTHATGKSTDAVMAGLQSVYESSENRPPRTPREKTFLSILNGVMGDHLVKHDSPLAIPMTLSYRETVLGEQAPCVAEDTSGRVLLLIHGSCMNDFQQHARQSNNASEPGDLLSTELVYSPIYVRYNSGLHVSQNGQALSAQLEQLLKLWPEAIEEISVVAHSMGGLVMRSAFMQAQEQGLRWPSRINKIVFLGTPHHGAPLERAGNWLDTILAAMPSTRPFAALGQLRSAGVTDLRYGNVSREDWHGHDRFDLKADNRQIVPLPSSVNCYTVAATLAEKRSLLSDRLVGDGLVPLRSALGLHNDKTRNLTFAKSSQWIAYRTGHMELLNSPAVNEQILRWMSEENTETNMPDT